MDVYNKLFTKILDSSIWLEPTTTRIVWLTFIATMDETGFVAFAAPGNVANRARVELSEAEAALAALEAPDPNSSDPDNDGRRIERVQGGWMVLNAAKYRAITTRIVQQEQTKIRVARHRAKKKAVTECNAQVTPANDLVTTSEAEAETEAKSEGGKQNPSLEDKILWEGKTWWPSHLQKQLALVNQELVGKEGEERKLLKAKRSSLMIALGVKIPVPKLSVLPRPKPERPPPTPEEGRKIAEALRKAVEAGV